MAAGVNYTKPSTDHWVQFSLVVAKEKVFAKWIDIAFSLAVWSFIRSTPSMDLDASMIESKHNSMLVMMYLQALRIIFDRILEDDKQGILSVSFTKVSLSK